MAGEDDPPAPAASLSTPPPQQKKAPSGEEVLDDAEAAEVVIFSVKECFVYKVSRAGGRGQAGTGRHWPTSDDGMVLPSYGPRRRELRMC